MPWQRMDKEERKRFLAGRGDRTRQTLIYGAIFLSLLVYEEKAMIVGSLTLMLTMFPIMGVMGFLETKAELRGKFRIGWFQQEWPWYLTFFTVAHGAALITLAVD